jgi:hypothetical protein
MKKFITLISLIMLTSCAEDLEFEYVSVEVPDNLLIEKEVGIKLESKFIDDVALMNVKINAAGIFTIKVIDIRNEVVSKEVVRGEVGDNLFKVYTNTLPISSYRIELFCDDEKVGAEVVNLLQ